MGKYITEVKIEIVKEDREDIIERIYFWKKLNLCCDNPVEAGDHKSKFDSVFSSSLKPRILLVNVDSFL